MCNFNLPQSISGPFSVYCVFSFSLIDEKKQFSFSMITVGLLDFSPSIISLYENYEAVDKFFCFDCGLTSRLTIFQSC